MKFKDLYLPIGLIVAFIIGLALPHYGTIFSKWSFQGVNLLQMIIFSIFLLTGYQLNLKEFSFDKSLIISLAGGIGINIFLAPLLAFGVVFFLPIENALKIGIITIACVPPTMASGIILTDIALGNKLLAMILTVVINTVGIFIIPFTFSFFAHTDSVGNIDALKILETLLILVLLPAIIGHLIRKKWSHLQHPLLFYFQPTAIILIAYMAISKERSKFFQLEISNFIFVALCVLALHILLLLSCSLYGKLTTKKIPDRIALTFVCAQKTLPLSLAILSALPIDIASIAAISCILYHLTQILVDSFLAVSWAKKEIASKNSSQ